MSTNDEPETPEVITEDVSQDAVADLAKAKAEAEDTKTKAEVSEDEVKPEPPPEADSKEEATLTTEDHDLDWHKKAYAESTAEAMRLKKENDELKAGKVEAPTPPVVTPPADEGVLTPEQLYIRQKQNEEITEAFSEITVKYPSLKEKDTYDKFTAEANLVGRVIVESEKRYPSPKELYEKTAVILGLTPDNSEALSAIKDSTSTTKTASTAAAASTQSKVSEEMISANLKMYPGKSRQEIIEELEPHIN